MVWSLVFYDIYEYQDQSFKMQHYINALYNVRAWYM